MTKRKKSGFLSKLKYREEVDRGPRGLIGCIRAFHGDIEVGRVGFRYIPASREVILGDAKQMFRVNQEYRNRGIATELGHRALDMARREIDQIDSVRLATERGNYPMERVASKLGFYIDSSNGIDLHYKL